MKSLKDLLIAGPGPSSSHTIGPYRIAKAFYSSLDKENLSEIDFTLYGSLALTGKGHGTDEILSKAIKEIPVHVSFVPSLEGLKHPNTMDGKAIYKDGHIITKRYESVGGGAFCEEGKKVCGKDIYPFSSFDGMKKYMEENKIEDVYTLIERFEDKNILEYGKRMLTLSFTTIERSLKATGILPGPLHLERVAGRIYAKCLNAAPSDRRALLLSAYAYATSEANATHEIIVTAPTCGAAGVVPAVLYYEYKQKKKSLEELAKSYLVGALVCDFIKENASLSGALLGCQAEIGSASSFASSALAYLDKLSLHQIEYAAEVNMEHFLGLTCDPVDGYVQIPCIERNAMAAIHSFSAYLFAKDISPYRQNRVSFDNVVKAMKETGNELPSDLKETSLGGLAKVIC